MYQRAAAQVMSDAILAFSGTQYAINDDSDEKCTQIILLITSKSMI